MKNIVIVGAGGFGREVQWLIERINEKQNIECGEPLWNIIGYIDDGVEAGTEVNGHMVLGSCDYLLKQNAPLAVACAIGASKTRKKVIDKIRDNQHLSFPNLIDPSVQMSDRIEFGVGNLVCAGNILTVNIKIENFCIINLDCTVGHDDVLSSFVTVYPSVNISGCVNVGECAELGTGTQIIQGKCIGTGTIVGVGSGVVRDLAAACTAVGAIGKIIIIHEITFAENWGGGNKQLNSTATVNHSGLLILGAGGHGKVVADIASFAYEKICFIDDSRKIDGYKDIPVVGDSSYAILHKERYDVFVAIGDSRTREQLNLRYKSNGVTLVSLVHPDAYIAADVEIGSGTVIMAGTVVNGGSKIGDGVILNTGATVDHDNQIGDYSHISVGAHLAGTVTVGKHTWIGAGSVISNNLHVCDNCLIGAGAAVVKDITEPGTYLGVPASMRKRENSS